MKLLVTTSRSVLRIDPTSGAIEVVHRGRGLYFGIAHDAARGRWFVGARDRMMSSGGDRDAEQGSIIVFDEAFRCQGELRPDFPMRDIHGMAFFDETLWVACSRDNFIARFDGAVWDRWHPLPGDSEAPSDIRHYNTIAAGDKTIRLVAHNHGASDLHLFDRRSLTLASTIQLGELAHNTWIEGDEYFTCSSGDATITGSCGFQLVTGGFPRGYAQGSDGMRYVGINENAPRAARDDTTSMVRIYDPAWRPIGELELPDEGMLLELVPILPATDVSPRARATTAIRSLLRRRTS